MRKVVLRFYVETEDKEKKNLTLCAEFSLSIKMYTEDFLAIEKNGTAYIKSKNIEVLKEKSSEDWENYFSVDLSFGGGYVKTTYPELNFNFPRLIEPGEYPYYEKK